jgi:hypothetical protein
MAMLPMSALISHARLFLVALLLVSATGLQETLVFGDYDRVPRSLRSAHTTEAGSDRSYPALVSSSAGLFPSTSTSLLVSGLRK